MNLPNLLTMFRFVLIPVYIYFIIQGLLYEALAVVIVAGITDVLDGYIARKRQQVTVIGKMLDPLADKTLMIVVVLSFVYLRFIPWQAALLLFIREAAMIAGSAIFHFRGYYLAIVFIFLQLQFAVTYLWAVIIFSFLTSIVYVMQFRSLNELRKK